MFYESQELIINAFVSWYHDPKKSIKIEVNVSKSVIIIYLMQFNNNNNLLFL